MPAVQGPYLVVYRGRAGRVLVGLLRGMGRVPAASVDSGLLEMSALFRCLQVKRQTVCVLLLFGCHCTQNV